MSPFYDLSVITLKTIGRTVINLPAVVFPLIEPMNMASLLTTGKTFYECPIAEGGNVEAILYQ